MKRALFLAPVILTFATRAAAQAPAEAPPPLPAEAAPSERQAPAPSPAPATAPAAAEPAFAEERPAPLRFEQAARTEEGPPPLERIRISGGLKIGYVATKGFDAFAATNTLPQFSLDATYAFLRAGRVSLAAGLGWDVGGRGSDLRGLETRLSMHRFLVPIEARMEVATWLWAFGKLAPGAALLHAEIEDPSSPNELADSAWAFAGDLSAGASFVFGKHKPRSVRVLLTPEIGYAISSAAKLRPNPGRDEGDLLGADADVQLRSVALSGLFWRATLGVAF